MNKRVYQGGSVISFVVIGVVLSALAVGAVFWVNNRGEGDVTGPLSFSEEAERDTEEATNQDDESNEAQQSEQANEERRQREAEAEKRQAEERAEAERQAEVARRAEETEAARRSAEQNQTQAPSSPQSTGALPQSGPSDILAHAVISLALLGAVVVYARSFTPRA